MLPRRRRGNEDRLPTLAVIQERDQALKEEAESNAITGKLFRHGGHHAAWALMECDPSASAKQSCWASTEHRKIMLRKKR